jgi:hypothetical protein
MKSAMMAVVAVAVVIGVILNFHFVIYSNGATVVKKEAMTFDKTYIDARDLGPIKWAKLPPKVKKYFTDRGINKAKKGISRQLDKIKDAVNK